MSYAAKCIAVTACLFLFDSGTEQPKELKAVEPIKVQPAAPIKTEVVVAPQLKEPPVIEGGKPRVEIEKKVEIRKSYGGKSSHRSVRVFKKRSSRKGWFRGRIFCGRGCRG